MIETLRLENLAIVERAELEFGAGLNVLTGETGAGKSIVLGALSLLAGQRASVEMIRAGSPQAVVEAVFRTEGLPDLEAELEARGIEVEGHELIVRRTLARSGRSRAQVSGQLVPVSTLAELFAGRLEISSQHDSQALRRPETQGLILDRAGGLLDQRRKVSEGYERLRAVEAERAALGEARAERERQRDFLRFQIEEIEAAELDAEAIEALTAERARLAHAERLGEDGRAALAALAGDPLDPELPGAGDRVAEAERRLQGLLRFDASLAELAARVSGAREELRDAAMELERYLTGVEADPARLEAAEARLHHVQQLQRKYGGSVEEVLRFRDRAMAELAGAKDADEREQLLGAEAQRLRARLERDARALSEARARAAGKLARAVQGALRELAMPRACFEVELTPVAPPGDLPCGPAGCESTELRLAANPGEPPRALSRVASGGELSRTFLALKQAARDAEAGMVLVFDEVDAGIGGRAADRVGRSLAELAAAHQVLCITHLPQVAARAALHLSVSKLSRRGRTGVRLARVEGSERVEEIARMAGGEVVAEATREHARALLGLGSA